MSKKDMVKVWFFEDYYTGIEWADNDTHTSSFWDEFSIAESVRDEWRLITDAYCAMKEEQTAMMERRYQERRDAWPSQPSGPSPGLPPV